MTQPSGLPWLVLRRNIHHILTRIIRCRCTSPSPTGPPTATIGWSRSVRRPSVCGRRRMPAPPILSYALTVEPQPHFINWQQDPQGNHLARVVFPEKVDRFEVTVDLVADMVTVNPFDFFLEPEAETFPFAYDPVLDQELAPFRKPMPPGPLLTAAAGRHSPRRASAPSTCWSRSTS